MAEQHTIVICHEAFGAAFDITVEPKPAWANFACERPDHRSAVRYATSLRTVHGWKIRDETGEPS